jgi:hypothetical protein
VINADFDIDLPPALIDLLSSFLAAHFPVPKFGKWIGGGCFCVNISADI